MMKKDGKRIKMVPGDRITCEESELKPFLDKFRKIESKKKSVHSPRTRIPHSKFTMEHRGGGKYNVINEGTGEKINDNLLTKEEALLIVGPQADKSTEDIEEVEDGDGSESKGDKNPIDNDEEEEEEEEEDEE
jgi:hypothetical protein